MLENIVTVLIIVVPILIIFQLVNNHSKRRKDRANGIDPDAKWMQIEKEENEKKEKENYERYFKNQGH